MRKRRERSERRPSGRGSLKKTKNMLGCVQGPRRASLRPRCAYHMTPPKPWARALCHVEAWWIVTPSKVSLFPPAGWRHRHQPL